MNKNIPDESLLKLDITDVIILAACSLNIGVTKCPLPLTVSRFYCLLLAISSLGYDFNPAGVQQVTAVNKLILGVLGLRYELWGVCYLQLTLRDSWNRLRSDICTVTDEALLKSNLKTHLLGTALNTYRRCDISLQFL